MLWNGMGDSTPWSVESNKLRSIRCASVPATHIVGNTGYWLTSLGDWAGW